MFTLNDPVFLITFPWNNPTAIWTHSQIQHKVPSHSCIKFQRNFTFSHLEIYVNFVFYSIYYLSVLYKFEVLNYVKFKSLIFNPTSLPQPGKKFQENAQCLFCGFKQPRKQLGTLGGKWIPPTKREIPDTRSHQMIKEETS